MGWFWADGASRRRPYPVQSLPAPPSQAPPPSCPMHTSGKGSIGPKHAPQQSDAPACPVATQKPSVTAIINPLNYMPAVLSQERTSQQRLALPTDRVTSSIPRGDKDSNWEYPSPQQMYNAMLRKGYDDTPEDAVESMVEVHNFLNEGAWNEIEAWEARFAGGLMDGWRACRRGEEGFEDLVLEGAWRPREGTRPKLMRLMGRPSDMTPKARMYSFLAWAYPGKFVEDPPFDRHDWFVQRTTPDNIKSERRYVIDYYSGPPEPTGEPVFYLDVRPAIDSPIAACERLIRSSCDIWFRASGVKAREEAKMFEQIRKAEAAREGS